MASFVNSGGYTESVSLGAEILGAQLLDVYSFQRPETASIGNSNNDCFIRFYDSDIPRNGYFMGTSNLKFYLNKASNIAATQVGIGTKTPLSTLHVHGKITTSSIDTYNVDDRVNFSNKTLSSISNVEITGGEFVRNGVIMRSSPWSISQDGGIYIMTGDPNSLTCNVGIGTGTPLYDFQVEGISGFKQITTSDPSVSAINCSYKDLSNVRNLQFYGELYQGDSIFKTTQWTDVVEDAPGTDIYFMQNVGIGTSSPSKKLHVIGDLLVTGDIYGREFSHVDRVDGLFRILSLYAPNQPNNITKRIVTNDATIANRVLYTFQINSGRYFVSGNLPFKNVSSLHPFPNYSWARIELYEGAPGNLTAQSRPSTFVPLQIYNDSTEVVTQPFTLLVENMFPSTYSVVLSGKGHELEVGSTLPSLTQNAYLMPIRGLGQDTSYTDRFSLQSPPIQGIYTNTTQSTFVLSTEGKYTAYTSNVEIFKNGLKQSDGYTVLYSHNTYTNITEFTVSLTTPPLLTDTINIIVWPNMESSSLYASGFYYQNNSIYQSQWLNMEGGSGIRYAGGKVVIDGDIILSGNVYSACNLAEFHAGSAAQYSPILHIESNVVGTFNLVDGAVTIPKVDFFDSNLGIGTRTAVQKLHVVGNVFTDGSVGVGTAAPRQLLDVQGGSAIVSGNIGIGTTTPQATLHVQGTTFATGNVGIGTQTTRQLLDVQGGSAIVSGNIGIGTTTPKASLHVQGTTFATGNVGIGTQTTRQLLDVQGGSAIVSGNIGIGTTTPQATLHVQGTTFATGNVGIGTQTTRQLLDVQGGSAIVSGNIGIGTTTPQASLHVQGTTYMTNTLTINNTAPTITLQDTNHNSGFIVCDNNILYIQRGANNSTTATQVSSQWPWMFNLANNDATCGGNLNVVSDITAFTSDMRLKTNLMRIPNALEKVQNLSGYYFDWKNKVRDMGLHPSRMEDDAGLIAQEVQSVFPQAVKPAPFDHELSAETNTYVSKSGENYITVQYDKLVPLLVEAIKELSAQVQALQARLQ